MVETITPVVHGGRRSRWLAAVALHAAGATATAAAFGAALGVLGQGLGAPWGGAGFVLLAAAAVLYALRDLAGLPVPVPERRRQVPEWWRTSFPAPVAALLYGAGLGIGFLTYLRHGTLVVVAGAALVSGDALLGAVLVGTFGVVRGLSLLVVGGARTAPGVSLVVDRLDRIAVSPLPRLANGAALTLVAAGAVLATMHGGPMRAAPAAGPILAAVFGWAAAAKAIRPGAWAAALEAYRLPDGVRRAARAAVPAAEAAVAVLLLAGRPVWGATAALTLLAGFSAVIVRARRLGGESLPCGCFGGRRPRGTRLLLARNAAIAAVALVVLARPSPILPTGLRPPEGGDALAGVLVLVGLVLASLLWRSVARLYGTGRGSMP